MPGSRPSPSLSKTPLEKYCLGSELQLVNSDILLRKAAGRCWARLTTGYAK